MKEIRKYMNLFENDDMGTGMENSSDDTVLVAKMVPVEHYQNLNYDPNDPDYDYDMEDDEYTFLESDSEPVSMKKTDLTPVELNTVEAVYSNIDGKYVPRFFERDIETYMDNEGNVWGVLDDEPF